MLLLLRWLLRQVCAQSSLPSLTSTVLQDALGLTLACLTPGLLPAEPQTFSNAVKTPIY